MTNYNEKLDEVLDFIENYGVSASTEDFDKTTSRAKAKADINSLFKELVAEAKPPHVHGTTVSSGQFNRGVSEFEQNLLKALEEVNEL